MGGGRGHDKVNAILHSKGKAFRCLGLYLFQVIMQCRNEITFVLIFNEIDEIKRNIFQAPVFNR